jgi:hypothetical protein
MVFQNLTIIAQISEEEEIKNFSNKLTGISGILTN